MSYYVKLSSTGSPDDVKVLEADSSFRYRRTYQTMEEAEVAAEKVRKRMILNSKKRQKTAEAREIRLRRLERFELSVPGISKIIDRVDNDTVDSILDGLEKLVVWIE